MNSCLNTAMDVPVPCQLATSTSPAMHQWPRRPAPPGLRAAAQAARDGTPVGSGGTRPGACSSWLDGFPESCSKPSPSRNGYRGQEHYQPATPPRISPPSRAGLSAADALSAALTPSAASRTVPLGSIQRRPGGKPRQNHTVALAEAMQRFRSDAESAVRDFMQFKMNLPAARQVGEEPNEWDVSRINSSRAQEAEVAWPLSTGFSDDANGKASDASFGQWPISSNTFQSEAVTGSHGLQKANSSSAPPCNSQAHSEESRQRLSGPPSTTEQERVLARRSADQLCLDSAFKSVQAKSSEPFGTPLPSQDSAPTRSVDGFAALQNGAPHQEPQSVQAKPEPTRVDATVDQVTQHLLCARDKIEAVELEFANIMNELATYGRSTGVVNSASTTPTHASRPQNDAAQHFSIGTPPNIGDAFDKSAKQSAASAPILAGPQSQSPWPWPASAGR